LISPGGCQAQKGSWLYGEESGYVTHGWMWINRSTPDGNRSARTRAEGSDKGVFDWRVLMTSAAGLPVTRGFRRGTSIDYVWIFL